MAWVLWRAFGPLPGDASDPAPRSVDVEAAVELARRSSLAPRIAARCGSALTAELGAPAAEGLARDRLVTAAHALELEAAADEVAARAAQRGMALVLLKHAALERSGVLAAGSRGACDVDLLLAPEAADELHAALAGAGWEVSPLADKEHQLPPLRHPAGAVVELHRLVPGVRLDGRRSARLGELAAAGLLRAAPGLPPGCSLPVPAVLVAHAIAHGLAQHGYAPQAYPALRTLGDLLDLGLAGEDGEELAARAEPWLARDLDGDEVAGMLALCRRLAAGEADLLAEPPTAGPEAALLHHFLAGASDEQYRRALHLSMLARPVSDRSRLGGALMSIWRTVFPGAAGLRAIYRRSPDRPPAGRLATAGRFLLRPFDLARRAIRYGVAAARTRLR